MIFKVLHRMTSIVDKNVFSLVLRHCWPQDFMSLALSCKKIWSLLRERQFWFHLCERFWPGCTEPMPETGVSTLRSTFINMWTDRAYKFVIAEDAQYPLELVRWIWQVKGIAGMLFVASRTASCSDWSPPDSWTGHVPYNDKGRENFLTSFKTARWARRVLSTSLEGGDVTSFGDAVYFHNSVLLKPLIKLGRKTINYPIGTRIKLLIFKKDVWGSCQIQSGDQRIDLVFQTEFLTRMLRLDKAVPSSNLGENKMTI